VHKLASLQYLNSLLLLLLLLLLHQLAYLDMDLRTQHASVGLPSDG
jgi:hypothetical protein